MLRSLESYANVARVLPEDLEVGKLGVVHVYVLYLVACIFHML